MRDLWSVIIENYERKSPFARHFLRRYMWGTDGLQTTSSERRQREFINEALALPTNLVSRQWMAGTMLNPRRVVTNVDHINNRLTTQVLH